MVTILIVDDDVQIRSSLKEIFELEGYGCLEAENGQAGLELARQQRPDLVVCDTLMPVMDGYQMIAELQRDPELATIPVIILAVVYDQRRGAKLGVSSYLVKPFTAEELLKEIQARLDRRNHQQL